MKKICKKFLTVILAITCLLSTIPVSPVQAETSAGDDGAPMAGEMQVLGDNLEVRQASTGVRVIHNRNTPGWARAYNTKTYSTDGDGIQLDIKDIAAVDSDYSIAVKFGNNTGWYDSSGVTLIYGKSGLFSAIATDGVTKWIGSSPVLVSEQREELEGKLSINVKLDGSRFVVTVNDKSYSFSSKYVGNPYELNFVFGVFGDGDGKTYNFDKSFESGAVAYTIAKIKNITKGVGYEPIGDIISAPDASMLAWEGVEYRESDEGVQIAFTNDAPSYARAGFENTFVTTDEGVHVGLKHIASEDPNYSIVVRLGSEYGWYDTEGYLFVYGKSGEFSILWMDGETNPNNAKVLVSDKREELGENLEVDVVLNGDTYKVTVNGKEYSIPGTYPSDPEELYLLLGAFADGNIKTLNYSKGYIKAALSFVVVPETYIPKEVSIRTLRPFADYMAFMTGVDEKRFKPEQNMSREEAIVTMASLLIEEEDIKDVYSSDFTDIDEKDAGYDYIAYMERSQFLPDFGEELKPEKEITRGEFADLLLDVEDVSEGLTIADVKSEDELYGKICYAVEKGILELDADGKFNKAAKVSRGEAAKAFCIYIGKTNSISEPEKTFSDVNEKTRYADYIILATNEIAVHKETYKATSEESIQACINKAVELSKKQDAMVTIELAEDVYKLTEPITIDGSSYGEYQLAITIKNAKDASPVISGNTDLNASDFTKLDGQEYYSYQLPETAKTEGSWPAFHDLYLNGESLQLAKSDTYVFTEEIKNPVFDDSGTWSVLISGDNELYVDNTVFEKINNENLTGLELCYKVEWTFKRWRVGSVEPDSATGLTKLALHEDDYYDYDIGDGNKRSFLDREYWFENHISLLDEPGEYYYDSMNGVIYFYPYKDTDMTKAVISYPLVEKLFDLKSVTGITFDGLTFTGITSNWVTEHGFAGWQGGVHAGVDLIHENIHAAAIYSDYSSNIAIRNCTFDELGGNAVYMNGGNRDAVIKGNSFTSIAMCAVIFGKHMQMWNYNHGQSNIIIDNNYIYDIGTTYPNCPAIHVSRVKNIAITHNSMIHTPYSGLHIGWTASPSRRVNVYNAEVAYNYCEDNVYALNDGAPLYFAGANALTGDRTVINRVHDNYLKSTGYTGTYNGIYLDIASSNYLVYNNLIEGFDTGHGPVFNQDHDPTGYTYNNTISNNFTTVRHITTTATADRFIILSDNKQFATATELPKEALAIKEAAGQKEKYASAVPKKDTEVVMDVKEPHIKVPVQGESDEECVTFTITNNSDKKASYSLAGSNVDEDIVQMIPSTESLELQAGETGTITVSFLGGDKVKRGEILDIAVVKDNGWKKQYERVIEIDVAAVVEETGTDIGSLAVIGSIAAVVIIAAAVVVTVIIIKRKKQ